MPDWNRSQAFGLCQYLSELTALIIVIKHASEVKDLWSYPCKRSRDRSSCTLIGWINISQWNFMKKYHATWGSFVDPLLHLPSNLFFPIQCGSSGQHGFDNDGGLLNCLLSSKLVVEWEAMKLPCVAIVLKVPWCALVSAGVQRFGASDWGCPVVCVCVWTEAPDLLFILSRAWALF